MEHSVPMERLPEGLTFPAELGDRIAYDAARKRLVFRGFMSKADFDRLCRLSEDWEYLRPLEDLFRMCVPDEDPPHGAFRRLIATLTHQGARPSGPARA